MTTAKFSYVVNEGDFISAGQASEDAKMQLKKLGLKDEFIRKVVICMYEGEINMVIHANGGTAEVEITPVKVAVTLTDTGKGIPNISEAMREGFSTATDEIRSMGFGAGMGLPNMKKYSDSLIIRSKVGEGTTVKMEFEI